MVGWEAGVWCFIWLKPHHPESFTMEMTFLFAPEKDVPKLLAHSYFLRKEASVNP